MLARMLAALIVGFAALQGTAEADSGPNEFTGEQWAAIQACVGFNAYGPAIAVSAVEDGLGDMLVWVEDAYGALWMCNASSEGDIYFNVGMTGDLLGGLGRELMGLQEVTHPEGLHTDPGRVARRLCESVVGAVLSTRIADALTVADGTGDYLVWVLTAERELFACNASGEGVLYALEQVAQPIGRYEPPLDV